MRIELKGERKSPAYLAALLGATLLEVGHAPTALAGLATHSDEVEWGDVFVALTGAHAEGSRYMEAALKKGAAALLLPRDTQLPSGDYTAFLVDDTAAALLHGLGAAREASRATVVAVAGSTGKTTVKEAVAAVLGTTFEVEKSRGNFNSTIGLPLSFLGAGECSHYVAEIGINHKGEMEAMSRALAPHVAVLTGVGNAHVGNFNDRAELFAEKMQLSRGVAAGGTLLVPCGMRSLVPPREDISVLEVGGTHSDFAVENINADQKGVSLDICTSERIITNLTFPITGRIGVFTAAFAGAVGALFEVSDENIRKGLALAGARAPRFKQYLWQERILIDDAYNASPEAVLAALEAARIMAGKRPLVAVIGDMLELGRYSASLHEGIGRAMADGGLSMLFTYGTEATRTARAARKGGMSAASVYSFAVGEKDLLLASLRHHLPAGAVVLFKASGRMGLSAVVDALKGE